MTTPAEWQDRAERAEAEIRAWIKENAPGGWIHALRAELARLREQEPCAWLPPLREGERHEFSVTGYTNPTAGWEPVYRAAPPAQPAAQPVQRLSDARIAKVWDGAAVGNYFA